MHCLHCLHCLHRHIHYTLHLILTRAVYWFSAVLRLVLFLSLSLSLISKSVATLVQKNSLRRQEKENLDLKRKPVLIWVSPDLFYVNKNEALFL